MSLAAILPVIYGVKELAANGLGTGALVTIVVGLLVGYAFVRRQAVLDDPVLDLKLFRRASFSVALLSLLLNSVAMSGVAARWKASRRA